MNESIRVSGKTVNDAVMNAAIALSTTSDRIEYTVIERESRGFLGIGAKDAVIEARVKEEPKEEPVKSAETSFEKSAEDSFEKPTEGSFKKPVGTSFEKPAESVSGKVSATAEENASKADKAKEASEEAPEETAEAKAGASDGKKRDQAGSAFSGKSGRGRKSHKPARETSGSSEEESYEERREKRNADIRVLDDPSEAIERAETFLKDVFASMDMTVKISSSYDGECLNVSMEGDEMGLLIGKRGQTLDSLQYLTSLVVNKGKPYYVRVKLDTEDYRERRKATLENLAKNIAIKVKKTRQTVYLEPMNPYERRIIHSALQDDPFVTTHSEGEEPDRKVVVTLKKDADLDALERKYGERSRRYGRGGRGSYGRGGRGSYGHGGRGRGDRSSHEGYGRDHYSREDGDSAAKSFDGETSSQTTADGGEE